MNSLREKNEKKIEELHDIKKKNQEIIEEKQEVIKSNQEIIDRLKNKLYNKEKELEDRYDEIKKLKKDLETKKEREDKEKQKQVDSLPASESNSSDSDSTRTLTVNASAYTASCSGCTGITATGVDVRNSTPNIIAVDPDVIPLGSKVRVEGMGVYRAEDTGGAIKGKKIDILMPSKEQARQFGRKNLKVTILN